jgi:type II secretory pathway component PulK
MIPDNLDLIRRRQRGRAIVMALLLGALVVLVFAVSIAKIRAGHA